MLGLALLMALANAAQGAPKRERAERAKDAPAALDLPETPAQLELEAAWRTDPEGTGAELPPEALGPARMVALLRRQDGGRALALAIMRFDAPNPAAWRASTRAAYVAEVEAAVVKACAARADARGARVRKRAILELSGVPALDLELLDERGARRWFRFVFFRTYAIVATIELDAGGTSAQRATARRAIQGFTVERNWQR